jgi:hypothetical protein
MNCKRPGCDHDRAHHGSYSNTGSYCCSCRCSRFRRWVFPYGTVALGLGSGAAGSAAVLGVASALVGRWPW